MLGGLPGSLRAALPALHDQFPSPACLSARRAVSPPAHSGLWLPRYLFVGALVWLSEMCLSGSSGIQHAAACLAHSPDLGSSLESIHIASYFWNRGIYCLVLFPAGFSSQLPRFPFPQYPLPSCGVTSVCPTASPVDSTARAPRGRAEPLPLFCGCPEPTSAP